MKKLTLLINCKDQPGKIAATTNFISNNGGNIIYVDQHVDRQQEVFFMRIEFEFKTILKEDFSKNFENSIANNFQMNWKLFDFQKPLNMGLFVSTYDHCIYDILGRYKSGEFCINIPFIVSNHKDLKPIADNFGINFYYVPVDKDNRIKSTKRHIELLKNYKIDFIALARYMQIIPNEIIDIYPSKIINIHHSFLPAFVGAKPYHSAFKRGVKIIGATSHYVTSELDQGPIIEQDVVRVSHVNTIKDLISKGRDLEKIVLSKAIKYHIDQKVMVFNNKTVIFN
jgi:formyltetrahydrofolate deformylase